jgi:hypothetical protein
MNSVPLPNSLSADIVPLCNSTKHFTKESPIPLPSQSLVRDLSTCTKRLNIDSILSFGIPLPVSFILIHTFSLQSSILTLISPPIDVNLTALDNKFKIILSIFSGSQVIFFSS